jgi:hypothetical protein
LLGCLRTLSSQQLVQLPTGLDAQLELLINLLRERRCLLVLDNLESLLQGGVARRYRDGYADYGQLLQRVGQSRHRSCLLLTSREEPPELGRLAGEHEPARLFALEGLTTTAGKAILQDRGVEGIHERDVAALVSRYSGNALALKLVAETIRDLFAGDIQAFLQEETPIFDDIRAVLDEQFARLAPLEQQLLTWLAIEREPVSLAVLQSDLLQPPTRWVLLEAARTLRRHALLETHGDSFTLQNVLTKSQSPESLCLAQSRGQGICAAKPGAPNHAAGGRTVSRQVGTGQSGRTSARNPGYVTQRCAAGTGICGRQSAQFAAAPGCGCDRV